MVPSCVAPTTEHGGGAIVFWGLCWWHCWWFMQKINLQHPVATHHPLPAELRGTVICLSAGQWAWTPPPPKSSARVFDWEEQWSPNWDHLARAGPHSKREKANKCSAIRYLFIVLAERKKNKKKRGGGILNWRYFQNVWLVPNVIGEVGWMQS